MFIILGKKCYNFRTAPKSNARKTPNPQFNETVQCILFFTDVGWKESDSKSFCYCLVAVKTWVIILNWWCARCYRKGGTKQCSKNTIDLSPHFLDNRTGPPHVSIDYDPCLLIFTICDPLGSFPYTFGRKISPGRFPFQVSMEQVSSLKDCASIAVQGATKSFTFSLTFPHGNSGFQDKWAGWVSSTDTDIC